MDKVGGLVDRVPPVASHTTCADVYEIFLNAPDLMALAVADHGIPSGIVSRQDLTLVMGGRFGRALYERRPVREVMDKDPLIVHADMNVERLSDRIASDHPSALLQGFIVLENGRYKGVGTALALLQANVAQAKRRNIELEEARQKTETAARAKGDFLAIMSHEIRTPMNGVLGMAQLMGRTSLDDEQKSMLSAITGSADALLAIINDILDLSKLESGKVTLEPVHMNLPDTLEQVLALVRHKAVEKNLSLELRIAPDVPEWLFLDVGRYKQVLFNLVGNALKFTDHGRVSVCVSHKVGGGGDIELSTSVLDTGVGICKSAIVKIFDKFSQEDESISRKYGGTGLGLTISRQIVQHLGGRIDVDSTLGVGSNFTFTALGRIGLARTQDPIKRTGPCAMDGVLRQSLRVLVAEDNVINQKVITAILKSYGQSVTVVANGRECVDELKSRPYDLIFMDVQMPEMDGMTATRIIRTMEGRKRNVPIVAITANAMKGDREKYLAAGMDDYISKPIDVSEIERVLCPMNAIAADKSNVTRFPTPVPNTAQIGGVSRVKNSALDELLQDLC